MNAPVKPQDIVATTAGVLLSRPEKDLRAGGWDVDQMRGIVRAAGAMHIVVCDPGDCTPYYMAERDTNATLDEAANDIWTGQVEAASVLQVVPVAGTCRDVSKIIAETLAIWAEHEGAIIASARRFCETHGEWSIPDFDEEIVRSDAQEHGLCAAQLGVGRFA